MGGVEDKLKAFTQNSNKKDNDIKILFAIENGSRSWQMASKDSDYDVRFVFFRKPESYISLNAQNNSLKGV